MSIIYRTILLIALLPFTFSPANAQDQTYYVPFPDEDVFTILRTAVPSPPEGVIYGDQVSVISMIPLASGSTIIYDHWEDGYEADILNPTQATTETWGDMDPSNGCGFASPCVSAADDFLSSGQVLTNLTIVPVPRDSAMLLYDGRDKVYASAPISMSRLAWNQGVTTVYAGAVEVLDVATWGTDYVLPVGEDIMEDDLFEYTGVSISAASNNTIVTVGTMPPETLNEGDTFLVNGGLTSGTEITSTGPIQVNMVVTDREAFYETRWYRLPPVDQFFSSYYNPVSTDLADDRTDVFLFNPGTTPISVTYERNVGGVVTSSITNVPSGATVRVPVTDLGTAQHYFAPGGEPFYAFAATDTIYNNSTTRPDLPDDGTFRPSSNNALHDWGFSLIPENSLTPAVFVGYGAGQDPLQPVSTNVSPIWVTPTEDTTIYADFNGDGGPNASPCATPFDMSFTVSELETLKVYDPDGDQSGLRLFTCDGTSIAAAWGQDPSIAPGSQPSIDVGTTVPPIPQVGGNKIAELTTGNDLNNDGVITPGETIIFSVQVINNTFQDALGVQVTDILDPVLLYVADSTTLDGVALPDDGATPFPLDEAGVALQSVPARSVVNFQYEAVLDPTFDLSRPVENCATMQSAVGTIVVCAPVVERPLVPGILLTKTVSTDGSCPGDDLLEAPVGIPITYCIEVVNTGELALASVTITDMDLDPPVSTNIGTLATGEVFTLMVSALLDAPLTNTASVVGTPPNGEPVGSSDPATVVPLFPSLALDKTVSDNGACPGADSLEAPVGTPITFCVEVMNDGETILNDVTITDADLDPPVNTNIGTLAVGESEFLMFPALLNAPLTNTASATGTPPGGTPVGAMDDAQVTPLFPSLALSKTVSLNGDCPGVPELSAPIGVPITYCIAVTNDGQTVLERVIVSDPDLDPPVMTNLGTLAVGESELLMFPALLNAPLTNTASATGTPPGGTPVGAMDDAQVTPLFPSLALSKTVSLNGDCPGVPELSAPIGVPITYCIAVTNDGQTVLERVIVSDPDLDPPVMTNLGTLAVGESELLMFPALLNAPLTNTASATGTPPGGTPVGAMDMAEVVPLIPSASLEKTVSLDETCPGEELVEALVGTPITYCLEVVNDGQTVLTDAMLFDNDVVPPLATNLGTLVVGQVVVVAVPSTIDAPLVNTATLSVSVPGDGPPLVETNTATVVPLIPAFTFDKSIVVGHQGGANCDVAGDVLESTNGTPVTYCFLVENTGTAILDLELDDPAIPNFAAQVQPGTTIAGLAPGDSALFYLETLAVSNLVNVASLTATPPGGEPIRSNDTTTVVVPIPAIELTTAALCGEADEAACAVAALTALQARPGDLATFCYTVRNSGETFLSNITLSDPSVFTSAPVISGPIAPGETATFAMSVTVDAGLTGAANVTADSSLTNEVPAASDPVQVVTAQPENAAVALTVFTPQLRLTKTVYEGHDEGASCATAREEVIVVQNAPVTFCFLVENTGDIALDLISLTDDSLDPAFSQLLDPLAPGAQDVFFLEFTATESLLNLASVSGRPSGTCLERITVADAAEVDVEFAGLGDFVWLDRNADGVQDADEPGVPNITVALADGDGNLLDTTVTDANGAYAFNNLPFGNYSVRFDLGTLPTDHVVTLRDAGTSDLDDSDASPSNGRTPFITLVETGAFDGSLDMGIFLPHELGNTVWLDRDNNGFLDAGEATISGVPVNLYTDDDGDNVLSQGDTFIGRDTTDPNGDYRFIDLRPGDYIVQIDPANFLPDGPLEGHVPSDPVSDPDNDIDGDNNGAIGAPATLGADSVVAQAVTLAYQSEPTNEADDPGGDPQSNLSVDFGFYTPVRVGNLVWHDINNDGTVDASEPGLDGVTVDLLVDGDVVLSTITAGGGMYLFDDLKPGVYTLRIPVPPADHPISSGASTLTGFPDVTNAADDQTDNDDNGIQAAPGEFTISPPITLWSQSEPTTDGDDADGDLTIDFGFYTGVALGDTVWFDDDFAGDRDAEEAGVPGVSVLLALGGESTVLASTVTGADGGYLFTNLPPATYQVTFDLDTLPTTPGNHAPTLQDAANDRIDSDADVLTGQTPPVALLASGDSDLTIDMGIIKFGFISGFVWNDVTNDGDARNDNLSVLGINDVRVDLFRIEDGGASNLVATATTGPSEEGDGFFAFENVYPGFYVTRVRVEDVLLIMPNLTTQDSYVILLEPCGISSENFFGFLETPTAIGLATFTARLPSDPIDTDQGVTVAWSTAWEEDTLGFFVHRLNADGSRERLNDVLILATGGGAYELTDPDSGAFAYELEELTTDLLPVVQASVGVSRLAPPSGGNTSMIEATDDLIEWTVGDTAETVFAHSFSGEPLAFDVRDPQRPVRLEGEIVDGTAIYFSAPAGTPLVITIQD